jgi:hypothetical protein
MSNSVISQKPFNGVNSPQTPRDDWHMQLGAQVGSPGVTMKNRDQRSAARDTAIIDPHPAFSLWWKRWREARTRVAPTTSIRGHS